MNFRISFSLVAFLSIAISLPATAQKKRVDVKGPHGTYTEEAPKTFKSDKARITNFRRKEMRAISGHYRSLEAVIRYKAPFNDALMDHANAVQTLAARLPKNFVKGSAMTEGKWGAKPNIWSDPKRFQKHYESFQQSIANLKTAITSGNEDDKTKRLNLVRHECLACHKTFRVRKKRKK